MSHRVRGSRPHLIANKNALSDQHVIVIGAGYAGLMCALRLAPQVRVTLVDPAVGGDRVRRVAEDPVGHAVTHEP
jgi:2-polyprenyl-6-methoxyphenol hydroxylase-like FAD-dependent oxidoreductase